MGLLDRVSTLMRANLNDLLDRAEDPEKVIKQLLIDMNNQLLQVKTQVAASIADEKRLYQRYHDRGLAIVGVSLDTDGDALRRFVLRPRFSRGERPHVAGASRFRGARSQCRSTVG